MGKRFWLDPQLRAELVLCNEFRISHSTFRGNPTPGVWTDEDRAKALATRAELARLCQSCGTKIDDWIDPETRRPWDVPKWEAVPHQCPGCMHVQNLSDHLPENAHKIGMTARAAPYDPERETESFLQPDTDGPDPEDHV